eukprot:2580916-Prymnesium_polylepis.1
MGRREQTPWRRPARSCARNWMACSSRHCAQTLPASVLPTLTFIRRRFCAPSCFAAATTVARHTSGRGGSCCFRHSLTVMVAWIWPPPDSSSSAAIMASASDSLAWRPPPLRRPPS